MTLVPLDKLSDSEKSILTLVLEGNSIIDTGRFRFQSEEEVRRFLQLNEYDITRPKDQERLAAIHNEACGYLKSQLQYDLPREIREPARFLSLFLTSKEEPFSEQACVLLKTMNIINHIDGRELLYNCPISLRDVYSLVEDKIERALTKVLKKETPLLKYEGGRKSKESLITKLLSKKETIAAQINDRVRYRLVVRKKEDLVEMVLHLFKEILPFNYLIPGASVNQLIDTRPLLTASEYLSGKMNRRIKKLASSLSLRLPYPHSEREYSGKNYRVVKFVVDLPIRLDRFLSTTTGPFSDALGSLVYVLVEFQIVDEETNEINNTGVNGHAEYKKRQKTGVLRRVMRR